MNTCWLKECFSWLLLLLSHFSHVRLCATPSLGFSRQEHWSGLPFPSPMHKSEKWKWSHSVMSDSWLVFSNSNFLCPRVVHSVLVTSRLEGGRFPYIVACCWAVPLPTLPGPYLQLRKGSLAVRGGRAHGASSFDVILGAPSSSWLPLGTEKKRDERHPLRPLLLVVHPLGCV